MIISILLNVIVILFLIFLFWKKGTTITSFHTRVLKLTNFVTYCNYYPKYSSLFFGSVSFSFKCFIVFMLALSLRSPIFMYLFINICTMSCVLFPCINSCIYLYYYAHYYFPVYPFLGFNIAWPL